jgi:hypothetical protein
MMVKIDLKLDSINSGGDVEELELLYITDGDTK